MTNNPTIDGVLVPRKLAEKLTEFWFGDSARNELRALLDAPAVKPENDLREHCKQCAEVVKTWPEWNRGCLGGAPAVERQENKCGQCSASSADICNQNGCGFLESGNGEPEVAALNPNPEAESHE